MIIDYIVKEAKLPVHSTKATLDLLHGGATVPFIARYRKEATGNLKEEDIFNIQALAGKYENLSKRKETILAAISEQGLLNPALRKKIESTWDENKLEDFYLPYKKSRKTKADKAREYGLEPLAKIIMAQRESQVEKIAKRYCNKEITTGAKAIEGAQFIIAEWISDNLKTRDILRQNMRRYGSIKAKVVKTKKEDASVYRDYWDYTERVNKIPSHRVLAILRGNKEGLLRIGIDINLDRFINNLINFYVKKHSSTATYLKEAIKDAVKRLIFPSTENQIIQEIKEKAEKEALEVFSKNLRQLLLAPPLGNVTVLALDPGFRTGCKVVCLDENGALQYNTTIFPHPPQNNKLEALDEVNSLLKKFQIKHIAIGNGTAGRKTQEWLDKELADKSVEIYLVNEDGASIYSASEIAREEFPHHDITVRGAVSIGRRLIDPLSELVKIDPKSIGVGQYQHDINKNLLKTALDQTVLSSVNKVGINLNTASKYLLQYISGLGPSTADNIVQYRQSVGGFTSRSELLQVNGLGAKTYEQAVGFLRVKNSENVLDNTAIHPESYGLVEQIAVSMNTGVADLLQKENMLDKIQLEQFTNEKTGLPTLRDIIHELKKPGHDPRGKATQFRFDKRIRSIEDLEVGMILPGIVSNLTNFGAFVNIGLKDDGLVHISQISDTFISDPAQVLSLAQKVKVKIIDIDIDRKRISLSMKL